MHTYNVDIAKAFLQLLECNPFVPLMKQTYETLVRNEVKATNISIFIIELSSK
jgi:hypothetical protein